MDQEKDISLLTQDFTVLSYHADNSGGLSLSSLCNFFQEIAWNHANILGIGYDHLLADNKFWVLIRMYIEVYTYPCWRDTVTIHTWPKGTEALMALRDFKVMDAENRLLAAASTGWLILNKDTKRPVRLDEFRKRVPLRETEHAVEKKLLKIETDGAVKAEARHTVAYSDLDVNNHVNNAKYVEWIMDAWHASAGEQLRFKVRRLEINFLSEAFLGEEAAVQLLESPGAGLQKDYYARVFRRTPDAPGEDIIRARFSC